MALTPGTRLGVYEVTAQIGEGGMGQVYRATDTKLKRQVALKILPPALAADADRLARFQREAEVLASLNHPNIAAIHGLEESPSASSGQAGLTALVMELVEGDDLSERIARGAIPIDEALPIAKQVAEALEAAHGQGIIHRDLKPANIKIRADGTVKVLDFGLAKALEPRAPSLEPGEQSPTITTPAMTQAGMILGTAAYMSPEQAKGRTVDKRADIWAFGCVLFEMLTGRRAFPGEDITDTLAAVVRAEPEWSWLPRELSPTLLVFLRRSLQKDPRQRVGDIHDVRLALEGAFDVAGPPVAPAFAEAAAGMPASQLATGRRPLALIAALTVAATLIAAMAVPTLRYLRQTPPPEMRLEITTPATSAPLQFALSPDGRHIVFVASGDGQPRLWLRPLDKADAQPLAGTEGAQHPFWSADSRSIGFYVAPTRLLRVDIAGGSPQLVARTIGSGRGGAWSADGTILFQPQATSPLWRIAAAGGEPVAVTRVDPPRLTSHSYPDFLPDGRHFLFYATGTPEAEGIYLGSLDGGDARRLTAADQAGAFLKPDRVVFLRQGTLVARRLDLARGELTGDPVTLADEVGAEGSRGGFSVSGDGQVAYRRGGGGARHLTWVDRAGKAVGIAGEPDANAIAYPEVSPDGRRVAMSRAAQGNGDIWLMDLVRGGLTRLTFDPAAESSPVWSPDGTRVGFSSNRKGAFDLYVKPSNGSGAEELLRESPTTKQIQDWSADGRFVLYYELDPKTGRDLFAMDMTRTDHPSRVVVNTPAEESLAELSPDGRWVVYQTNESGRYEIVVQPFPEPGGKWQVSTGGGVAPRWRADGREIYFLAPDATMMAVPVTSSGQTFGAGTPGALFPTRIVGGGAVSTTRPQYAVARDGRFLINQPVQEATATPITLILNWRAEEKK